ncbi:anhydro-N-acetylmuramic acid kinase [Pseudovibrio sp. Ad46]|uniref:GNAT family N-acetyltransferase n=1 Tax=unclassified Pseudovibrio TaxID=2627060 RepID=UPI0007B25BAE|nr:MULTISPECIES: GNAT family N-acetyltransferase [unclassified Pseudovibrio]KZK95949.1 anhydro-N-acetylmuramic acid kinase [Pseudovibrio sp. Ad46]KZL00725.1 anhydro-N-acetylmuramic acid kinase [Pseudovibrio sp. Ad5]
MVDIAIDRCSRIETERLVLRKWELADLDGLVEMNADPRVMEFYPSVLSRAESEKMLARYMDAQQQHGFCFSVASEKRSGRFLGYCGLKVSGYQEHLLFGPCVEIGWRLLRSEWGKGFATEAAQMWLGFGLETLKLNEIVSFTPVQNSRSEKVMQRLGMVRVEEFAHPMLEDGHRLKRQVLYKMTRQR